MPELRIQDLRKEDSSMVLLFVALAEVSRRPRGELVGHLPSKKEFAEQITKMLSEAPRRALILLFAQQTGFLLSNLLSNLLGNLPSKVGICSANLIFCYVCPAKK